MTICRECVAVGRRRPDPAVQFRRLRAALSPDHAVRTSLCLDACTQANVMVVQPAPAARRAGARPVWLGLLVHDEMLDDLAAWVRAGGPGVEPLPGLLSLSEVPPAQRGR
ncbi:hypothetical protein [Actinoplanes sp. TFC3]|uniref:hypothetical protein n=1 Tax=Actinoplanes sp. TFC3 TaxID=1710355 RepID=UPI00082D07F8